MWRDPVDLKEAVYIWRLPGLQTSVTPQAGVRALCVSQGSDGQEVLCVLPQPASAQLYCCTHLLGHCTGSWLLILIKGATTPQGMEPQVFKQFAFCMPGGLYVVLWVCLRAGHGGTSRRAGGFRHSWPPLDCGKRCSRLTRPLTAAACGHKLVPQAHLSCNAMQMLQTMELLTS